MSTENLGPTGEILKDLPSPYIPHSSGLLHLPRFIAKIRKSLSGALPKSYQRNYTKGFDGFLCLHLGIESADVVEIVKTSKDNMELDKRLKDLFPENLNIAIWNRKLVQMGMSEMGREKLEEVKMTMGISDRKDLISFADMIDVDEGRL
tara:strand:- start:3708 stop:4154 length:447 start_codon:yes stop_codon:yes gene_type:complete